MCPTRTAPGRRVPNVQLCKAAAGTLLPPLYSYSAGTGSGLFARPVAGYAALRVYAIFGGFGGNALRQRLFSVVRGMTEISFRRPDVMGIDEREFAPFGDTECRVGQFVLRFGGEAVVRLGLCRPGCRCVGAVAEIRKFPASGRFFCPVAFYTWRRFIR